MLKADFYYQIVNKIVSPNIAFCAEYIPAAGCTTDEIETKWMALNTVLHSQHGYFKELSEKYVEPQDWCDFSYIYDNWPVDSRPFLETWHQKLQKSCKFRNKVNIIKYVCTYYHYRI